jgi:membrane protein implicated in regulation of membrane protease activity
MRKLVFGATFLVTALTARAAAAGARIQPVLCVLAILLGLALVGLVVLIPTLLLSSAIRRFFNHQDAESDEPEARFFDLTSAMEARPPEIAAKR